MAKPHFIRELVRHYSDGADAVERSYIRAMGESLLLSAASGASIYSGLCHQSVLEISVGVSSFLSSFAFHEIAAKSFLRKYNSN